LLKAHWRFISRLERIGDNLIVITAFFLTYYFRDSFFLLTRSLSLPFPADRTYLAPIEDYLIILGVALPAYNAFLSALGAYRRMRFSRGIKLFRPTLFSSILVFLTVGSVLFLLKLDLSRSFVGIFCVLSGCALAIERYVVLRYLQYWRMRGKNYRNLLIAGTGLQARKLYRMINNQPELGVRVVGFVDLNPESNVVDRAVNISSAVALTALSSAVASLPVSIPLVVVACVSSAPDVASSRF